MLTKHRMSSREPRTGDTPRPRRYSAKCRPPPSLGRRPEGAGPCSGAHSHQDCVTGSLIWANALSPIWKSPPNGHIFQLSSHYWRAGPA